MVYMHESCMCAKTTREGKQIASQLKVNSTICDLENTSCRVMKKVILAKVETNQQFRHELLGSGDTLLVESLASDLYRESGLSFNLTLTAHPDFYHGNNNLGKLLCGIRTELIDHTHSDLEKDGMEVQTALLLLNNARARDHTPSTSCDAINTTSKSVGSCNATIPRSRHAISKLNIHSASPNHQKGTNGNKFDAPMLKDFLRQQVKMSQHGSPLYTQSGKSTHNLLENRPACRVARTELSWVQRPSIIQSR